MTCWQKALWSAFAGCVLVGMAGAVYWVASTPRIAPVEPEAVDLSALDGVSAEAWAKLRTRRIYFGHQSVGSNIIAGIEAILRRKPEIGLRIVSTADPNAFDAPGLIHGPIGVNGDTRSKMHDFAAVVLGSNGPRLDVALMKFCYADLTSASDPAGVLAAYQEMIDEIARQRPDVQILHSSVPLTAVRSGPKALIKRLLGHRPDNDNAVRGAYNQALRSTFEGREIFDIAAVESSATDARPMLVEAGGRGWPSLAPELTSDGGHLNPGGQVVVARELLLLLARQASASGD